MTTRRVIGKASDDNPIEGVITLLAKMIGVNASEIQLSEEMIASIYQQQSEKLEIKKIINPFYEELKSQGTKDSKKKLYELIDLGKFIYYLAQENEIEIVECGEQPDFVIKYKNELIGIEHTGIYDDDVVAEIKTLKKIIDRCQKKLTTEHSEITGLFNIIVIPSKLKEQLPFKKAEIIQTICDYIIEKHQNIETTKPDFISDVIRTQHQILELTLGEDYWLAELTPEAIGKAIVKKEGKIDTYKSLKELSKCWLLIVIDGASSASSFKIQLDSLPMHLTPFDKIFIFDNFKGTIIKG
ncbi:MAG: hypothetical protein M9904_06350 [Chitinophagaceae bacterium]|nr:hypothetical protein [Chitinophagaceae bacterium]